MSERPITRFFGAVKGCLFVLLAAAGVSQGQVVTFEGFDFPESEDASWMPTPGCEPERWIQDGRLFQHVEVGCGGPPGGDVDRYERSLADFVGADPFFIEFRLQTDGDSSEIPGVAPAALAAGGFFGITYHFTIASDLVRFQRDAFIVTVFVEIERNELHTYRVELYGTEQYFVFVDGIVIDSGVPGGQYPGDVNDVIAWRAKAWYLPNTTKWDYVRLGNIPQNASADFDNSSTVDPNDLYFFQECLADAQAGSWPGCAWADMDQDGDTDCDDWALFQAAWTDPGDPPTISLCDCPTDLTTDGTTNASDLAQLLGAWGENPEHPADLTDDGAVDAFDLAILLGTWGPCN